ncbi:MAG: response regulator [Nitrospirota bacterium]
MPQYLKRFKQFIDMNMTRPKILIVDDDQTVISVVKIALEDRYEVAGANNALKALGYLSDHEADLVILDINMPGISGLDAIGEIKAKCPETVIIMLTSDPSAENIQKATSRGAYGFIFKPFDLDGIRNYVDAAINVKTPDKQRDNSRVQKTIRY